MLRRGVRDSRAAVFYPEAAMWASYTPSTERRAIDYSEKTRRIDIAFARSMWALIRDQIDCDCIDRRILAESRIEGGKLLWGDRAYDTLVFPCARVIEEDALEKLLKANDAGIRVLFCEDPPEMLRETGKGSESTAEIARRIADGRMFRASAEEFSSLLESAVQDGFRSTHVNAEEGSDRGMLLSHVRRTEEGEKPSSSPIWRIKTLPDH